MADNSKIEWMDVREHLDVAEERVYEAKELILEGEDPAYDALFDVLIDVLWKVRRYAVKQQVKQRQKENPEIFE